MSEITIGKILEDLRVAEEVLRKFERRYWITSEQFYERTGYDLRVFVPWE